MLVSVPRSRKLNEMFFFLQLFLYLDPKIRLQYRNAGYIEIKDASSWRVFNVENWDRNYQELLCQHLGFEEDDDFLLTNITSGKMIATGDLMFYNETQSGGGGASCCVDLQRSATTSKTSVPNARCKYKL